MLTTSSALVVFSAPHVASPEFLGAPAMIAVLGFAIIWILAALALLEWYLIVLPNGRLADDFRDAEAACETLMPLTVGLLTLLAIYVLVPAARSSFRGLLFVLPIVVQSLRVATVAWHMPDPRAQAGRRRERRPFPQGVAARRVLVALFWVAFAGLLCTEWAFRRQIGTSADAIGALCFVFVAFGALWFSTFPPIRSVEADPPTFSWMTIALIIISLVALFLMLARCYTPEQMELPSLAVALAVYIGPGVRAALDERSVLEP
jgi:hypothetical protein